MPVLRSLSLFLLQCALLPLLAQDKPLQYSENGWYLSPSGTIRILVLFVEVDFDVTPEKDPQPDGAQHWEKRQLPKWKDEVFDPFPLPVQKAEVSRYYQDISLGHYTVLGDYFDEIITLKESEYPGVHQAHSIGTYAVKEASKRGTLRTHNGLTIADFDLWKEGGKPGQPKEAGADDPHSYDHVMVITRNSNLRHGTGSTDPGSPGKLFGHESDTQSRFGGGNSLPFKILKHEFNHLLLGGNNFHSGGGNAAQFESNFVNLQGGWSMMGANGSSLLTCCAWDRDRLNWKPDGATHRIRAHDTGGGEVNGDLDPINGDTGVFILRDFVPSGDALRISMPYIAADQQPQWLWVENHQGYHRNGSPTDRFQWEASATCIAPIEPGLFMTMQVGREEKEGKSIYGGRADYLRPVLANGNFDMELRGDTLREQCLFNGTLLPYLHAPHLANPLTGNHEQELPLHDRNNDGQLQHGEHWVPGARIEHGQPMAPVTFAGRPEHAFRMNGNRKLGMCTNPSTTNMLTLISTNDREKHGRGVPNVRTSHLNGISVELLNMSADGAALVRVRNNDTRMEADQRWCSDTIVLHPVRGTDGHALTIASGKRLLVDRSRTPTRMTEPDNGKGGPWFSDPSWFRVMPGASILLEDKAVIELTRGSTMELLPGSALLLGKKSLLKVDGGSRVIIAPGVQLLGKPRIFRRLRKQGRMVDTPAQ
ncbi:MAG TPA: hypothetical protein PLB89_02155 [Flavobacteriales bacterium]|nr:hypothetical protein [Flavobacteriales bacterium]